MSKRLDGKVAVITGAASGIGAATAKIYVEQGARIVLGDIQDEAGEALAEALGGSSTAVKPLLSRAWIYPKIQK